MAVFTFNFRKIKVISFPDLLHFRIFSHFTYGNASCHVSSFMHASANQLPKIDIQIIIDTLLPSAILVFLGYSVVLISIYRCKL